MGRLRVEDRIDIAPEKALQKAQTMFEAVGAPADVAKEVAHHLVEAEQSGVASHGLVRVLQYTREMRNGVLAPMARPEVCEEDRGRLTVDARGGIGIPAMRIAQEIAAERASEKGLAVVALLGAGHTGRLGAFGEIAARKGCLSITIGGGNRQNWRQVAPYGGRKALLPTNPYCIAMPGGERGPVVVDIATSQSAGGWIYAARAAGVDLPEGLIIDREGHPSCDPEDYFKGGAILPKGGPLGYGMALIAELIGEAMLGSVEKGEINWLILALDCERYAPTGPMQAAAEEILAELRQSEPATGHDKVMIPGERERDAWQSSQGKPLSLSRQVWEAIETLSQELA